MIWIRTKRIFKLGLLNFWRNRWLSLGSVLVIMLTLVTITVSVVQNIDIHNTIKTIKDKLDLTVYFDDKVTESEIQDIQLKMESRPDIKSIKYISKAEALLLWQQRPSSDKIKDLVTPEDNPLPRSLLIKTSKPEELENIANLLQSPSLAQKIHRVSYKDNKDIINQLIERNNIVSKTGIISSLAFFLVSLIVIINTMRLIILTRKDEIEIMRLVGSSDLFIKAPFVVEAILAGLIATTLSLTYIIIGIYYNIPIVPLFISRYFGDATISIKDLIISDLPLIFSFQLLIAFILTISITFLSLRRYLKS